jgi:hypothetical protein
MKSGETWRKVVKGHEEADFHVSELKALKARIY